MIYYKAGIRRWLRKKANLCPLKALCICQSSISNREMFQSEVSDIIIIRSSFTLRDENNAYCPYSRSFYIELLVANTHHVRLLYTMSSHSYGTRIIFSGNV